MTNDSPEAPRPETPVQPLTNLERLEAHLKPDGLAAELLRAWREGDQSGAENRLRNAVSNHFAKKKSDDGKPSHPEN
jgi:hypothetical protein